jgi:hypothetical protein
LFSLAKIGENGCAFSLGGLWSGGKCPATA